jgi:hypothetical protein
VGQPVIDPQLLTGAIKCTPPAGLSVMDREQTTTGGQKIVSFGLRIQPVGACLLNLFPIRQAV